MGTKCLNLRFIMVSLSSQVQCRQRVAVWYPSFHCTGHPSYKSCSLKPQDEAAQWANLPPMVRHCKKRTSPELIPAWSPYAHQGGSIQYVKSRIPCSELGTKHRAANWWWSTCVWMIWMALFVACHPIRSWNCPHNTPFYRIKGRATLRTRKPTSTSGSQVQYDATTNSWKAFGPVVTQLVRWNSLPGIAYCSLWKVAALQGRESEGEVCETMVYNLSFGSRCHFSKSLWYMSTSWVVTN